MSTTETPDRPAPDPGPGPDGKTPWLMIAAALVAIWVVFMVLTSPRGVDDLDGPGPGGSAAYDWTLKDLDGADVTFDRFRGKALFVNVWATWCPPCVAEMPSIARLAATPELQGKVEFVCVSIDDGVNVLRSFLRGKDWPMTVLHADRLPPVFLTDGIPATFFVAPDGRIAYKREGSAEWDSPEVVRKLQELAERPARAASAPPATRPALR